MIIWIDGAIGVGKSIVSKRIRDLITNKNVQILDSDLIWQEYLQKMEPMLIAEGRIPKYGSPQTDRDFWQSFLSMIREAECNHLVTIVTMAIPNVECEESLIHILENDEATRFIHIVLEASDTKLRDRLRGRSKAERDWAEIENKIIKQFEKNHLQTAIHINTEERSETEVAEIIAVMAGLM